jgi:hypothetical protein
MAAMERSIRALGTFLTRDMIYVLGGFSVYMSFVTVSGQDVSIFLDDEIPGIALLFFLGLSYVIGFAVQELFSFLRLVTTSALFEPGRIVRFLYWCYVHEEWRPTESLDPYLACVKINEARLTPQTFNEIERTVRLLLFSATTGSCAVLSGLIFAYGALRTSDWSRGVDIVSILVLGVTLLLTNRVKAAQYRSFVCTLYSRIVEGERRNSEGTILVS